MRLTPEEQAKKRCAVAQKLLEAARRIPVGGLGYTILVHDETLSQPGGAMALASTLPTSRHVRIALADALVCAAREDGGTPDTAADMCAEDAKVVLGIDYGPGEHN